MRRVWTIIGASLAAVGAVVSIIAALVSKEFRDAVGDAWEWAYPGPLLIAAALAILGLTVVLMTARRDHSTELAEAQQERDAALSEAERDRAAFAEAKAYSDERARAHDERLFADTRRAVPRSAVEWIEAQDFAAPWRATYEAPFSDLLPKRNVPELRFRDPELETRRADFFLAVWRFLTKLNKYSSYIGDNLKRVRPQLYDPDQGDRYEREAEELNELSWRIVETYNAFIEGGQAREFDVLDT